MTVKHGLNIHKHTTRSVDPDMHTETAHSLSDSETKTTRFHIHTEHKTTGAHSYFTTQQNNTSDATRWIKTRSRTAVSALQERITGKQREFASVCADVLLFDTQWDYSGTIKVLLARGSGNNCDPMWKVGCSRRIVRVCVLWGELLNQNLDLAIQNHIGLLSFLLE